MQIGRDSRVFAISSRWIHAVWHVPMRKNRSAFAVAQGCARRATSGRDLQCHDRHAEQANTVLSRRSTVVQFVVTIAVNGELLSRGYEMEGGQPVWPGRGGCAEATEAIEGIDCVADAGCAAGPQRTDRPGRIWCLLLLSAMAYALYQRSQPTMTAGGEATCEQASDISAAAQLTGARRTHQGD